VSVDMNAIAQKKKNENQARQANNGVLVLVGLATCGIAAGAKQIFEKLGQELAGQPNVSVERTGCIGMCQMEPLVEVHVGNHPKVTYAKVTPDMLGRIIEEHIKGGKPVADYMVDAQFYNDFFGKQERVALRNCGVIDPENIDDYLARDGYAAMQKVLTEWQPQQVVDCLIASGLRGRGGGGFPTGTKWKFAIGSNADQKFVLCNADEGDPGAFMDRSVLEGDPHALLEAMAIAGYTIGANQGYIYVRAEYPVAVKRLNIAIDQAKAYGLLGNNIMGTDFSFDLELRLGAGAFVCGEETALIASIEGNRGEPRPRPPFPAVKGLFGKPSILNNVETYANIPQIILNGAEWFAAMGTEKSKGTKVFALGGKINNTGLVEVKMGTTLRDIVEKVGGGCPNGKAFKAAQTGGPSGGCLPASLLDIEIDYDNLISVGSMMGSGGLIVMDEDNCMVDIARFFLEFTVDESCGKCTPCRVGNRRMLEILERITSGKGEEGDIERLETLAKTIASSSLCGLGQTAPNPVLSTLRYFRHEYEAHIRDKKCPAGHCQALLQYSIDAEKCKGCSLCARKCPVSCISGEVRQPYTIDAAACIKCGACMDACKFGAVERK